MVMWDPATYPDVGAIADLAKAGISAFKLSTYEYDAVRFPRIDHPTMLAAFRASARTAATLAELILMSKLIQFQ